MGKMVMKWECLTCGKVNTSDSSVTHQLDMCSCGNSGIDLEEYYTRFIGDVREISTEKYDDDGKITKV